MVFRNIEAGRGNGVTAARYIQQVLEPAVVPHIRRHPNLTLQQDNARPHTARSLPELHRAPLGSHPEGDRRHSPTAHNRSGTRAGLASSRHGGTSTCSWWTVSSGLCLPDAVQWSMPIMGDTLIIETHYWHCLLTWLSSPLSDYKTLWCCCALSSALLSVSDYSLVRLCSTTKSAHTCQVWK